MMEVTVFYKEGAPNGILVESHEMPDEPLKSYTLEEKWGSVTEEKGGAYMTTTRLVMNGHGLVMSKSSLHRDSSEPTGPMPTVDTENIAKSAPVQEDGGIVIVPASELSWVDRVEADSVQVWPHVVDQPDELDAIADKLGGIVDSL